MGGAAASNNEFHINGGTLTVNAGGDGLDSNGSINMTGGTVIVNGPTNSGNGALDYDGTFEISGGYLVAAGRLGYGTRNIRCVYAKYHCDDIPCNAKSWNTCTCTR